MLLKDIFTERRELIAAMDKRREEFDAALKTAQTRLAELRDAERLVLLGLDYARIERGRKIVAVLGKVSQPNSGFDGNNGATRSKIVEDAKVELAGGGGKLWEQYLGAKNYDGFGDQREDHRYGYGPRHGSIVFSVGLSAEVRGRGVAFLRPEEVEDALYLLAALPSIEAALREERAA